MNAIGTGSKLPVEKVFLGSAIFVVITTILIFYLYKVDVISARLGTVIVMVSLLGFLLIKLKCYSILVEEGRNDAIAGLQPKSTGDAYMIGFESVKDKGKKE